MRISEHIYKCMKKYQLDYSELDTFERDKICQKVYLRYIDFNKRGRCLWEKLIDFEVVQDPAAWRIIKEFVKKDNCLVFFDEEDDKKMLEFHTGEDLNFMLSETWGFEFYVTNEQASFLFCFNHHDILYACGTAGIWLKRSYML